MGLALQSEGPGSVRAEGAAEQKPEAGRLPGRPSAPRRLPGGGRVPSRSARALEETPSHGPPTPRLGRLLVS